MKEINALVASITRQLTAAGFTIPTGCLPAAPVPVTELKIPVTPEPAAALPPAHWGEGLAVANLAPVQRLTIDLDGAPVPVPLPPVTKAQVEPVLAAAEQAPAAIVVDSIPSEAPANTPVHLRLVKTGDGKVTTLMTDLAADAETELSVDDIPVVYRPADFTSELSTLDNYAKGVYAVAIGVVKMALTPGCAPGVLGGLLKDRPILWPKGGPAELDKLAQRLQDPKTYDAAYDEIVSRCEAWLVDRAKATLQQDFFAAACGAAHAALKRDETRQLFKAIRARLAERGEWPKPVGGKLQQQVEALTDAKVDAKANPAAGKAEKQIGKDLAAMSKGGYVQVARRIARELGKNGPITIDDVTQAMSRELKVAPGEGDQAHVWKGSVFATSEWAQVGTMASRMKEAHGRPVALWALKTWLATNTLNGVQSTASAYNLVKIFKDFQLSHPRIPVDRCNWYIGDEKLGADVRQNIITDGMKLYGVPVVFASGGVGALLLAPNYAQGQTAPAQNQP